MNEYSLFRIKIKKPNSSNNKYTEVGRITTTFPFQTLTLEYSHQLSFLIVDLWSEPL